jgi:hypothetical protein
MYVAKVPNRGSPPAVLLRESYREAGKVKNRTLANLSSWPEAKVDALARVRAEMTPLRCWVSGWRPAPVDGAGGDGSMMLGSARAAAWGVESFIPVSCLVHALFVVMPPRIVINWGSWTAGNGAANARRRPAAGRCGTGPGASGGSGAAGAGRCCHAMPRHATSCRPCITPAASTGNPVAARGCLVRSSGGQHDRARLPRVISGYAAPVSSFSSRVTRAARPRPWRPVPGAGPPALPRSPRPGRGRSRAAGPGVRRPSGSQVTISPPCGPPAGG